MVATRMGKRVTVDDIVFELHAPDLTLPPDVSVYIHDKLLAKLAKFSSQITDLVVHLRDDNGTRGGVDKVCHIESRLVGHEPVNVEEKHEDLRAAVDLAIERTVEAVHRHLERTRSKRLSQGRKVVRRSKTAL
jgi:ribosome-associated translation inhibitor RaiA